jgi:hypothetical protein
MKKSDHSGRENSDESDRSSECGTSLAEAPVKKPQVEPQAHPVLEWFWTSLRYVGTAVILALLYLLSYGPVDHYYNSGITQVTGPNTATITLLLRPRWVETLYRPAFYLQMRSDLYNRYISRWNRDDSNKLIL